MDAKKMLELQSQMKTNQDDLKSFMNDLDNWGAEMKIKDESLRCTASEQEKVLPPVRNSLLKKKKKKKSKGDAKSEKQDGKVNGEKVSVANKSGYEYYKKWDKFDVDKACDELDQDEETESTDEETDEEWEIERKKQQASLLKDQGNQCFKEGKLDDAVQYYTSAIGCDPGNVVLPANRAMALIKQTKYAAAEVDCTLAISIDPSYTKSYYRRGLARKELGKLLDAKKDFERLLVLEPNNKAAQAEINKIEMRLHPSASTLTATGNCGVVEPIRRPPKNNSKKPLKRIHIEEIGVDTPELSHRTAVHPSVTEKDERKFDNLVSGIAELDLQKSSSDRTEDVRTRRKDDDSNDKTSTANSNTRSSQDVSFPSLPSPPSTSYQLQMDWKTLRKHPQQLHAYLQHINPNDYVKLFGEAFESNILMDIIHVLRNHYTSDEGKLQVLSALTKVKRFSMTVMFLSIAEKQAIKDVLNQVSESAELNTNVEALRKKYEV